MRPTRALWEWRLAGAGAGGSGKLLVVVMAEETLPSPPGSFALVAFPTVLSNHPVVGMCLMLAEPCAPTPGCPQPNLGVRASDSQNDFCQRYPSSSQPQSSWESLDFSSILLQKSFQMRKKLTKHADT